MRRFAVLLLLMGNVYIYAQNKQLLYDFKEIPQAGLINPGVEITYNSYFGNPLLSSISFQVGSSGASINDFFADDGLNINSKIRTNAIYSMNITDELSGTYQLEILNIGFRGKNNSDNFYSFGIYNEGDAISYWFKDYAILGFEGNANHLNKKFDISHLKIRGDMVNVLHFGLNKRVNKKFILGARAKLYSSNFSFKSTENKGYFVTTKVQKNLFKSTIVADMQLSTSGIKNLRKAVNNGVNADNIFTKRGLFGGDLGLGVDFGFTYILNKNTIITGSVLDLGFISHSRDAKNYVFKGYSTIKGAEVLLTNASVNPNTNFWQDLIDKVKPSLNYEENNDSYTSFRPVKLYGSIRYNFVLQNCDCKIIVGKRNPVYSNGLGVQVYIINRPRGPQMAITTFYQRNFGSSVSLKTTYTVDKFSVANIGLGASLNIGSVIVYAMTDNILSYQNIAASRYASFQLGISIISRSEN